MLHNLNSTQIKILSKLIFKKYYLRELAKEINEIPSTVLRNLNILENEKIIDSYSEGKNKYFFLPKKYSSHYIIKLTETYKTMQFLKKHSEKVSLFEDIKKATKETDSVIIFGSYAKSLEKKGSDLDILLVKPNNQKIKSTLKNIGKLHNIKLNPKTVNNIDLNNNLIREIISHHLILKGGEFIYEQIFENLDK